MRITDNRYAGELSKFDLAMRMIQHEARTGTIKACTGFSEDRVRKIYSTYFKTSDGQQVRRKRGKSPSQITRFVSSSKRQSEATVLACLFLYFDLAALDQRGRISQNHSIDKTSMGQRLCQAYENYLLIQPNPRLSFEWAWNLYHCLIHNQELYLAWCDDCSSPYVQDTYALDYQRCPFCDLADHRVAEQSQ